MHQSWPKAAWGLVPATAVLTRRLMETAQGGEGSPLLLRSLSASPKAPATPSPLPYPHIHAEHLQSLCSQLYNLTTTE